MLALGTIVVVECPPACFLLLPELTIKVKLLEVSFVHCPWNVPIRGRVLYP
jgi:hypothetical protein